MSHQGLNLQEWITRGRQNGTIRDVFTVIWAYCMNESDALAWVAEIVTGRTSEQDALDAVDHDLRSGELPSGNGWHNQLPPRPDMTAW